MRVTRWRWMLLCGGVLVISGCSGEGVARSTDTTTTAGREPTDPATTAAPTTAAVTDELLSRCLGGPRQLDEPTIEVQNTSGLPVTVLRPDARNNVDGPTVGLSSGYLHHMVRGEELYDVLRVGPDGDLTPVATVTVGCWADFADTNAGRLALVGGSNADGETRTVLVDEGGAILDELAAGPVMFDAVTDDWVAYPAVHLDEGGRAARVLDVTTNDIEEYARVGGHPTIVGRWMFSKDEVTGAWVRWDLSRGERDGELPGAPGPEGSCATDTRLMVLTSDTLDIVDPSSLEVLAERPTDESTHLGGCGPDAAWLLQAPMTTGIHEGTDARGVNEACVTFDGDQVQLLEIDDRDAAVIRDWSFTALVDRYGGPSTMCFGPHVPDLDVVEGELYLTGLASTPSDAALNTIWRLDP